MTCLLITGWIRAHYTKQCSKRKKWCIIFVCALKINKVYCKKSSLM